MIDPAANEAALRYMASEIQRLQLMLAQAVGNLALANKNLSESNGHGDPTSVPEAMHTSP